jgi:hypothetical protein
VYLSFMIYLKLDRRMPIPETRRVLHVIHVLNNRNAMLFGDAELD